MAIFEWVGCDARTGVVVANLPGLRVEQIDDAMMSYSTASASLTVTDDTDPEWLAGTRPGEAMLVLLANGEPIWGAVVTNRIREGADSVVLAMTSIAGYWRRRYVGDAEFDSVDQCAIAGALITDHAAFEGVPVVIDAEPSAFERDRTYDDTEDKSVFDALSELSGVENGPEWTIEWSTQDYDGQVAYWPLVVIRDRLGTAPNPGMAPAVTWEYPGAITACSFTEDFTDGRGANDVMATSSAIENVRPESIRATIDGDTRIKWEERFTPSTSIINTARLDSHALAKLARIGHGTRVLELTLAADQARPGVAFHIGDTVGVRIGASGQSLPAFPDGGLEVRARVVGFRADLLGVETITPILSDLEVINGRF